MTIGIYPTVSCTLDPLLKFPSRELVYDTSMRIRFANIRSVRSVMRAEKELRVLRGILSIARKTKIGWREWQWEAVYRPLREGGYSCDAIIISNPKWYWPFTRERLSRTADKLHMKKGLALVEHAALFMDGCLASFTRNHSAVLAADMSFVPPIHTYGK